ncbi:MAG: hypothetical protein R3343_04060 [Nitriliruptorales bacterium]|nr:hypothetical protein [Nitriliruptorales bacterium]
MSSDDLSDELTVTRAIPVISELPDDATAGDHADAVGLVYVSDDEPGLTRIRWGQGFTYRDASGETIPKGHPDRERAESLAIPPAWTDVWICRDENGHIQATGRDDAGRKQYLYHPRWRDVRDATKFHRLGDFADALPTIRETVDSHLRKRTFTREKMLALVVALLDETLIRIGSERYARTTGAHGLTTLEGDHVQVDGSRVRFAFPGKAGQERELELRHRRLARQLLKCEEIPGQRLFSYQADDDWQHVDSGAVNDYLREVAGKRLTAKDFRTWGGTVVAAEKLRELGPSEGPTDTGSKVLMAIDAAADRLGNTRAVARSSYVDPRVPKAYRFGRFDEVWDDEDGTVDRLNPAERAVRRILDLDMPPSSDLEAQLEASLEVAEEE